MARLLIREVTFQLLSDIFFETKFPVFTMRVCVCVCVREREREIERERERGGGGFSASITIALHKLFSCFT